MKESLYSVDKDCILRLNMESEDVLRSQNCIPTNVSFSNGVASFNGTSSILVKKFLNASTFSIRFQFTPTSFSTLGVIFDFRQPISGSSGVGVINYTQTSGLLASTSGTVYVNGIATSVISLNIKHDIVISGISIQSSADNTFNIGKSYANLFPMSGSIDLIEIYKGTLSANQVLNIFQNKAYKPFQSHGEISGGSTANLILSVDAFDGVIKNRLSGNVVGSELIGNSTFNISTGWNLGSGWYINTSLGRLIKSGAYDFASPSGLSLVENKWYKVTIDKASGNDIEIISNGSGYCFVGGDQSFPIGVTTKYLKATAYVSTVRFYQTTATYNSISIQEIIPSVVNTAVAVRRSGNINSMFFYSNGVLNMGSYNSLVGDLTIQGFIKPLGFGTSNVGKIVDNSKLKIGLNSTNSVINVSSDGSTLAVSATNAISIGKWQHFCITRTSTGVVNIYINSILSGTANQASGTPASGSTIYIGTTASSNYFNGEISNVQVFSGILSTFEISQIVSSTKSRYGL